MQVLSKPADIPLPNLYIYITCHSVIGLSYILTCGDIITGVHNDTRFNSRHNLFSNNYQRKFSPPMRFTGGHRIRRFLLRLLLEQPELLLLQPLLQQLLQRT